MISVVIPLYNKEKQIAKTLQTVLNQTYQDFEIVIVNDGSTDGSVDEVKKFLNPRIRLINQKNGGVSAARNRGIEEAKGEYIAFLDADDLWDIDHLEVLYQLILAYPKNGAYATAYRNNIEGATHNIILKRFHLRKRLVYYLIILKFAAVLIRLYGVVLFVLLRISCVLLEGFL